MTFSKEKKAQLRLEAAQKRKLDAARLQAVAPPNKALKAPPKQQHIGVNTIDYGGHYKALNFPLKRGSFSEVRLCLKNPKDDTEGPSTESMNEEATGVVWKKEQILFHVLMRGHARVLPHPTVSQRMSPCLYLTEV